ncbi:OPT oligopeptide transporter [Drepanopeziza brunnea f. sp. 'multigermtubi' MB_m1]|uniref:OPT oligopeptide transporter n=1 Tax=Marssonina brunnea f. sp. multigermtubi (strain MB_m1) TaxID=1072389 RepID=K1WBI2_MARBU|nr:OPT oligopeptide transporter [Drepanopeziza brunnea f. sp. 'multigermtubi' MB_m1]EKD14645.1 OPT oligopeptide transporter [Drepanopeziza brunnea f. sp. 'multigermtubi' MB_m1]
MAPDRGATHSPDYHPIPPPPNAQDDDDGYITTQSGHNNQETSAVRDGQRRRSDARRFIARHANEGQNFTLRGILVGLGVGLIICFSNMYFGLQTGWISSMSMPSSLIGFAFFKTFAKHLDLPFTPVENVLVQSVAGSMGTMPLGCGFVGVMPAMNYLLGNEESGPIFLGLGNLILWALGLAFFGVVFAVPLRRQVIIREKLKFPSGTATALMIGVLHGKETMVAGPVSTQDSNSRDELPDADVEEVDKSQKSSWKKKVRLLTISFAASGIYTLATYFFPVLRNLPVFGFTLAESWLWTFNPSLAYVGQGIIMGSSTTTHMLVGAVVGWGILSPLAKHRGWAPGPVDDWESGSKGWIVWVSLAIMLADSVISLGYIALRHVVMNSGGFMTEVRQSIRRRDWKALFQIGLSKPTRGYTAITGEGEDAPTPLAENGPNLTGFATTEEIKDLPEPDAPPEHLVNDSTFWVGLVLSIVFCVASIRVVFGALVPLYATIIAVFMALALSIMGVRALGETDLNPVSGISKLAQLFFALIIPQSNKNSVLVNLIAGAVSEAGALQAGDLMQDLKTGHLVGAAPNAQFWGQIVGSSVGAVVSALIYKLYTNVYEVPGDLFQVPTGYVWIFTARLVTGKGLPYMAAQWSFGAAVIFTVITVVRVVGAGKKWHPYIPGGIAVAVGMYNVPSFTLARAIGGFVNWYWKSYKRRDETPIVVLASGLILGEGVLSIINLLLASASVPHV